jgi:4-amino-4-deoxy-L-arabinose transferase-like glycosyltransferase
VNRWNVLVFVLTASLTLLVRWPDLAMPLERDEGEYAYAAQEMLRGFLPYRDSFCQKPPVVFFWYLLGFQVFGETVVGIHLTLAVAAAAGAFGLFLLAQRLAGRSAAYLAGLAFLVGSAGSGYFGSAANTEMFMLVAVIYGCLAVLRAAETAKAIPWLVGGACLGLAALTKQVAVFSFAGPCAYAAWEVARRHGFRSACVGLLWFAAGALAAALPILTWIVATGILEPFLEATVTHNVAYVGSPFGLEKWQLLWSTMEERFLLTDSGLWLCLLAAVLSLAWRRCRSAPAVRFALLWFVFSLLGVALGPFAFGHYFLQVLPPLALTAGVVCSLVMTGPALPLAYRRLLAVLIAAAVLLPMAVGRAATTIEPVEQRCHDLYQDYGPTPFVAAKHLGDQLRRTAGPEDKLLVFGSEPEILFYARRRSVTRYTIFYPLTGDYPRAEAMGDAMLAEFEADPPVWVILSCFLSSFQGSARSGERLDRLISRVEETLDARGYREEAMYWTDAAGSVYRTPPRSRPAGGAALLFRVFTTSNSVPGSR